MAAVLIIFTRYPEAGKCKTRLIPVLGAGGAARLQEEMTRRTLETVRKLAETFRVTLEVHFDGGAARLMQEAFGREVLYRPQSAGDLGERMHASLATAQTQGAARMVLIGTDCPGLTVDILLEAFTVLETQDLVLGPARDGGYYLIGCRQVLPALFTDMPWGSSQVLDRTLGAAREQKLSYVCLDSLPDVDRPEDLAIWEAVKRGYGG